MASAQAKMSTKKKKKKTRQLRGTTNVYAAFSQQQIHEFKEAFNLIDQDSDGVISKDDLIKMYTSLGNIPSDEDLDAMFAEVPTFINTVIFLTMFGEKLNGTDPEDVLRNAFACFDDKNLGYIKEDYLRECLMKMGEHWSEDMVDEMFQETPTKNGRFDYLEFTRTLKYGAQEDEHNME